MLSRDRRHCATVLRSRTAALSPHSVPLLTLPAPSRTKFPIGRENVFVRVPGIARRAKGKRKGGNTRRALVDATTLRGLKGVTTLAETIYFRRRIEFIRAEKRNDIRRKGFLEWRPRFEKQSLCIFHPWGFVVCSFFFFSFFFLNDSWMARVKRDERERVRYHGSLRNKTKTK